MSAQNSVLSDDFLFQEEKKIIFDENEIIKDLRRYLPAQAPLKDFIFQNNLESFQHLHFFKALGTASEIFGYNVFLPIDEFRGLYESKRIREDVLDKIIIGRKGSRKLVEWKRKLISTNYERTTLPRIGQLRSN